MVAIGRKRSAAPGMACEAGSEADIAIAGVPLATDVR